MTSYIFLKESSLFLEVAILMFAALIMGILGILLFPIYIGLLPYYENGVFGLFLLVFAFQIISMGKTPLGDLKHSVYVLIVGGIIALLSIITCIIPGFFGEIPKYLLILLFGINGIVQLIHLFYDKNKYHTWKKYGGIFTHLIRACILTYIFSILIATFMMIPNIFPSITSTVALLYGIVLFYLAITLQKVHSTYPTKKTLQPGELNLSVPNVMLLLIGIFMITLGLFLIPVSFGLIQLATHAQLGLLVTLFAIQIIVIGNTPVGQLRRTNFLVGIGFVLAAIGVTSCMISNDILTIFLVLLIAVLNIVGGAVTIGRMLVPIFMKKGEKKEEMPKIFTHIFVANIILNVVTIIFGFSMLISHLLPVVVVGLVLALNGVVLLYLMSLLIRVQNLEDASLAVA